MKSHFVAGMIFLIIMPCLTMSICAEAAKVSSKGIVYIVLAVDTEPLNTNGDGRRLELDLSNFSGDTTGIVARVMSSDWRTKFTDSFGGHPKLTWFLLTSEHICQSAGCTAIYDEMEKFSANIKRHGDELAWHYHHTDWQECTSTGKVDTTWTQLVTFNGTLSTQGTDVDLCENVLNHLIAEKHFFPVSFRSGWVWENNDFSRWLENVVPFDLSSSPPAKIITDGPTRCRSNESDWSRAPLAWLPYHPDSADYQRPGKMKRFLSRSLVQRFLESDYRMLAAQADSGFDAILSIPLHSYSDLRTAFGHKLEEVAFYLDASGTKYKFATSAEAFRPHIGDKTPHRLKLELQQKGQSVIIKTSNGVFPRQPYVVLRDSAGGLKRTIPRKSGRTTWVLDLTGLDVAEVVVAESNLTGESIVQSLIITSQ